MSQTASFCCRNEPPGPLSGSLWQIPGPWGPKSGRNDLKVQNEMKHAETCRFVLREVLLRADFQSGHETHLPRRVSRALRVCARAPKRGRASPKSILIGASIPYAERPSDRSHGGPRLHTVYCCARTSHRTRSVCLYLNIVPRSPPDFVLGLWVFPLAPDRR